MKQMKFHALALAAILSLANSAYAIQLNNTATHYLGAFDSGELYGEIFSVGTAGPIDHDLTFDITGALYAGSGVFDLSLGKITNINGLSADIFKSGNSAFPYASFSSQWGGDLLILPLNTYFEVGSYTLKIGGQATGTAVFGLPSGSYAIGAATLPVPEPETYAMLLVGLGLVGYRLRQKNRAAGQASFN